MNIQELHQSGLSLSEAGQRLGIGKEAVRSRARRLGITWVGHDEVFSPYDALSEAERLAALKQADRRFVRALAWAFKRGDHWPQAEIDALKRRCA